MKAFCYHQLLFDRTINNNKAKQSSLTTLENYAAIQLGSKLYDLKVRISHWQTLRVLKYKKGSTNLEFYDSNMQTAIEAAAKKWGDEL